MTEIYKIARLLNWMIRLHLATFVPPARGNTAKIISIVMQYIDFDGVYDLEGIICYRPPKSEFFGEITGCKVEQIQYALRRMERDGLLVRVTSRKWFIPWSFFDDGICATYEKFRALCERHEMEILKMSKSEHSEWREKLRAKAQKT